MTMSDISNTNGKDISPIPNSVYDVLKWVALVALPALAVAIYALGPIWNIAWAEDVAMTLIVLEVLLGSALGISSAKYEGKRDFSHVERTLEQGLTGPEGVPGVSGADLSREQILDAVHQALAERDDEHIEQLDVKGQ